MNAIDETRCCKNKKCGIPLPEGYKYKYCEKCRTAQKDIVKKGLVTFGVIAITILGTILTTGKGGSDD